METETSTSVPYCDWTPCEVSGHLYEEGCCRFCNDKQEPAVDMKAAIKAYCGMGGWTALLAYCLSVGITEIDRIEAIAERIDDWSSDGEHSY